MTITGYDVTLTWMQRDSDDQSIPGQYLPEYSWSYNVPSPSFAFDDFADFADCWLSIDEAGCGDADFDWDGGVDANDLQIWMDYWLSDS